MEKNNPTFRPLAEIEDLDKLTITGRRVNDIIEFGVNEEFGFTYLKLGSDKTVTSYETGDKVWSVPEFKDYLATLKTNIDAEEQPKTNIDAKEQEEFREDLNSGVYDEFLVAVANTLQGYLNQYEPRLAKCGRFIILWGEHDQTDQKLASDLLLNKGTFLGNSR